VPDPTVRDAVFDVLRERSLTKMFANPGSTEVPFLASLPGDLDFVLGLHEGSVVGMATGYALGRSAPSLAVLHTTAGLGNAVGALATARVNRAPLVVLVGQQDRRHLAHEPFLAGHLQGLAGDYPVWVDQPVRPQDLPGAIGRAWHEATTGRGPALVIAPMDDWLAPADDRANEAAAGVVVRAAAADPAAIEALLAMIANAKRPAIVAGSGSDDAESWAALVELAEKLGAPVWQESFGGQAGFPGTHPQFAGHLPADRLRLRDTLGQYDVVLVVGAPAFRQYPYAAGTLAPPGTRIAVVTNDPVEAHRSVAELAVVAPVAGVCAELARRLPGHEHHEGGFDREPIARAAAHNPLSADYVFDQLAARLASNAVVIEESPSNRPALLERVPAREPLGFLSPAMGGLGFAIPAATGIRMARPDRPVVAVVGDGSSLYSIQALWSAAHYRVGALFVILANGGYAIMDRLLEREGGGASPWPSLAEIDISGLARAFGCSARLVTTPDELVETFDEVVPQLADRDEPLVLEVQVAPGETFDP
jgi:benzoylformate decarboxylase